MIFNGMKVVLNPMLVEGPFEDWSKVRSPARARRRLRRGFPQRITTYYRPSKRIFQLDGHLVMHPAIWEEVCSSSM